MNAGGTETRPPLDGVLVVDKPGGRTSHDVVAHARRYFGLRAVGHAGTLDPMATGVLVLLFGQACKLSGYLTAAAKAYRARVTFGLATDTLDRDGVALEQRPLSPGWLSATALDAALKEERQRSWQVPPAISAIQQGGERAYARARRGESVELAARAVHVERLALLEHGPDFVDVELSVSKGYYVRSLARDLGNTLGVPAHLHELRRLSSGSFTLSEAIAWPPAVRPPLLSLAEAAQRALPVAQLSELAAQRARNGQKLAPEDVRTEVFDEPCAWVSLANDLVAIGLSGAEGGHRVLRGFPAQR